MTKGSGENCINRKVASMWTHGALCRRSTHCAARTGGHQRCVACRLRASPKCKVVGNDLDAALILPSDIDIETTKPDLEGSGGSGLTADAGGNAL